MRTIDLLGGFWHLYHCNEFEFLPRNAMVARHMLMSSCVCPFVCLFVTSRCLLRDSLRTSFLQSKTLAKLGSRGSTGTPNADVLSKNQSFYTSCNGCRQWRSQLGFLDRSVPGKIDGIERK